MSSITTLTQFCFKGALHKFWAFGQMQYAHKFMGRITGLQFYKLMGSGRDFGFSPLPDWGVYALLCVWDNEEYADRFFNHSKVFKRFRFQTKELWTVYMKPIQAKGFWSGSTPFTPAENLDVENPLIAVITRAKIRASQLIKFWNFVPRSQMPIERGCIGLIYTKGIGEVPILQMATFSLWENLEALKNFAYKSPEHLEAVRKTQELNWYTEQLFVRFQPYRSVGTWGGKDILAPFLKS